MIRIPSRRELLLGLGVAALSSAFIGIPGPAVAAPTAVETPGAARVTAWDTAPGSGSLPR